MYKCIVSTPAPAEPRSLSYYDVQTCLFREFRIHNGWTEECSNCLEKSPKVLFAFDRLEFGYAKAFVVINSRYS